MTSLRGLKARVDATHTSEDNRALSFDLFEAIEADADSLFQIADGRRQLASGKIDGDDLYGWRRFQESDCWRLFQRRSIDAAVSLIEKNLPGAEWEVSTLYGIAHASLPLNGGDIEPCQSARREDGIVQLAMLSVLLDVMIVKGVEVRCTPYFPTR